MSTACAFPDGVIHDHGNAQCHDATRRAGAADALRDAANSARLMPADHVKAAAWLRDRADEVARGESL